MPNPLRSGAGGGEKGGGPALPRRELRLSSRRWFLVLLALFAVQWSLLAISPLYRADWLLENVLAVAFIAALFFTQRRFPLSRVSYTCIFVFLALHEIGAHYTYSHVPYDAWWEALTGSPLGPALGWERNNFDRVIHFSYGLLLAYPVREVFLRVAEVRGFWGYFLPLEFTMATSMLFELFEWGAAELFGGELGMAYLGTQGDIWDSHKDMALASLGAALAMALTAAINASLQRDFAREWAQSLEVKGERPLGEVEIARMWNERQRES
jgi:putative membrane protein